MYVSAYEATVQRSTNKLSSVVNTTADYRGGANQADWDTLSKWFSEDQLHKSAARISERMPETEKRAALSGTV